MSRAAMGRVQLVCHSIGDSVEARVEGALLRSMDYAVQDMVSRRMVMVINEVEHGVQDVVARMVGDVINEDSSNG